MSHNIRALVMNFRAFVAHVGVCEATINRWILEGLPVHWLRNGRRFFNVRACEKWINANKDLSGEHDRGGGEYCSKRINAKLHPDTLTRQDLTDRELSALCFDNQ